MDRIEEIKKQCLTSIRSAEDEFKKFPVRLRRLRLQEEGNKVGFPLKQNELARVVDLLPPNYSRVEKGNIAPSIGLLIALSEVFGVTIDYLVKGQQLPQIDEEKMELAGGSNVGVLDELLKSKDQHIDALNMLVKQLQEENKRLASMVGR
jgi:transcriptional regulator with XRE-family HTH domain